MSGVDDLTPEEREISRVFNTHEGLRIHNGFEDLAYAFEREFLGTAIDSQFGGNKFVDYVALDAGYRTETDELLPECEISSIGTTHIKLNPEGVVQFIKLADTIDERQTMLDSYMGLGIADAFLAYAVEFNSEPANALLLEDRSNVASLFLEPEVSEQFAIGGYASLLITDEMIFKMQRLRAQFGLLYRSSAKFAALQPKFRALLANEITSKASDKALAQAFVPESLGKHAVIAKWDVGTYSTIEFAGSFPMKSDELSELLGIIIE